MGFFLKESQASAALVLRICIPRKIPEAGVATCCAGREGTICRGLGQDCLILGCVISIDYQSHCNSLSKQLTDERLNSGLSSLGGYTPNRYSVIERLMLEDLTSRVLTPGVPAARCSSLLPFLVFVRCMSSSEGAGGDPRCSARGRGSQHVHARRHANQR